MSDHKFYLKAKFSIYGKDFDCDMWCNWDAFDGGIDSRIQEFFADSFEKAHAQYVDQHQRAHDKLQAAETERQERNLLQRLREKYPDRRDEPCDQKA